MTSFFFVLLLVILYQCCIIKIEEKNNKVKTLIKFKNNFNSITSLKINKNYKKVKKKILRVFET